MCTPIIKSAGILAAVLAALGVRITQTQLSVAGIRSAASVVTQQEDSAASVAVAQAENPLPKAPAGLTSGGPR